VFERFTERARQVVVFAQEEARTLRHDHVGTEHILLGLARERQGLASQVLARLEVTDERVRAEIVRLGPAPSEIDTPMASGPVPFTPRAKKALELALRDALSLGHSYIGTEHVLLGLIRESDGLANAILRDFDTDADTIRRAVLQALYDAQATGHPEPPRAARALGGGHPRVQPDRITVEFAPGARRLLMSAAASALGSGRSDVEVHDLLSAMLSDEDVAATLTELGGDAAAIRSALAAREQDARPRPPMAGA